jgi:filamentous hemagglutinin
MQKLKQLISVVLSLNLLLLPLQAANIQVDGSTATTLDNARNGVPVVNIANPNAHGLSHNKFSEYNVAKQGVILNNSLDTTVKTQLGGYIFGNKNLTTNAKVILNEVTSTSRTNLNGYTEVAGKRADLIIANPNGISVNGAGFINTSNVTLSTGKPVITNGAISSYNIKGGDISIEGKGADFTQSSSASLYTQALKLNAKIYANKLDIKLGSSTPNTNTLLLDASALGGMYANAINLVGTNKGLGVNLPPEVVASSGDISITNDGMIKLQKVSASHDIQVDAKSANIEVADKLTSTNNINLRAKDITNDSLVNAGNDLRVTADNFTNNKTLFSGNDSYLYVNNTLLNNENANILTLNNLLMAADNTNAKTALIRNTSANIETLHGDINLYADVFENRVSNEPTIYEISRITTQAWRQISGDWRTLETKTHIVEGINKDGYKASSLRSGNNLNLYADVYNRYSTITTTGDILIDGSLNNIANAEAYDKTSVSGYVQHYEKKHKWSHHAWYYKYSTYNINTIKLDAANSLLQASGNINITGTSLQNGNLNANANIPSSTDITNTPTKTTYIDKATNEPIITIPTDTASLFVKAQPQSNYLIETNPDFAIYENFISSDYMMNHINYDAVATSKRLGDAMYENTLVRDSVFAQTGKRFLNKDIKNDNEQYQYLMDNAIRASQDLELSPGISLTQAQINALKKDIVWMEKKKVSGQEVLAPVVYIANASSYRLQGAQIIANDDINLNSDTFTNTATLQAGNDVTINANKTITNTAGTLKAGNNLSLQAKNEITNTSGTIKAKNIDLTSTKSSITNERYAKDVSYGTGSTVDNKTLIGNSANIQAENTLNINAADNFVNAGSNLKAKDVNLNANNVAITTTVDKKDLFGGSSDAYIKEQSTTHLASNINADNININSTENTNIKGSNLTANNNINIKAKELNILAVNNSSYTERHSSSKGFLSSSSSTDASLRENTQSSKISATNINMQTDNAINIESANINADKSIDINSKNADVNFYAKSYTNADMHESKSSSFGGLVGNHSIDAMSKTRLAGATTTASNSIVVGGKNINVNANDFKAKNGTIELKADENINIVSGKESSSEQHLRESTGLSLGLSGGKFTYAQMTKDSNTNTNITNKASNINANNLVLESQGDANIVASNVNANTMEVNVAKDFNVLADQDVNINNQEHSKKDLGVELKLNSKEASLFAGYWEEGNGKTTTQKDVAKSTLNAGTLNIQAKNANIIGSDVLTTDAQIDSQNTKILSATASTDTQTYKKSVKAGVSVGVTQNITDTIDKMKNITDAQGATGTASRTLKAYDAVNSFLQKPADAGVYAIYKESKTSTNEHSEQAVASNIYASNNAVLNSNKNLELGGSNIYANNNLELKAKNINLHATAQNYSSSTTSSSKNAKASLYGSDMGTVTLGFQDSSNDIEGTTHANTHITAGNKATLTSMQDTTLKGAVVDADELAVNVGRNLTMQSMQDRQSIRGESKGGSISAGKKGVTGASANYGTTKGDKQWTNEVTSLNGKNSIRVSINDTTTLKGASITNKDASGRDQGNLELNTKKLRTQDLHDHDNYKNTNVGIGVGSVDSNPSLNSIDFANNTKDKEQIVRATIGKGVITTNSDTTSLNRDTSKTKQITKDKSSNIELYASDTSIEALLNPKQAYNNLKQKAKDVGLAVYLEMQNIPSATKAQDGKGDFLDATLGAGLDKIAFLGLLPSQLNDGGYVTQIATQLFGDNRQGIIVKDKSTLLKAGVTEKDIQAVTLVKTKDGVKKAEDLKPNDVALDKVTVYRTNPDKKVVIGNPKDKTGNPALEDYKIRISEEDVKNSGINHLFTNGMFNSTETATYNQQTQQGFADGMLNYNQQHGILGDLLESAQDAIAVNTGISALGTGGARQTGEVIRQMADITKGNLTSGAHSQGTLMTQVGMDANKEYLKKLVQNNKKSKFLVQYSGSPVNHKIAEELVSDIYGGEYTINDRFGNRKGISNVFRSHITPQDAVGSVLGYQSAGINNSENLESNMLESFIAIPRLFGFGDTSPHSCYPCVIGCGNENYTPDLKNYYTPTAIDSLKEHPRSEYYKNNFSNEEGQMSIDTTLLPEGTK